MTSPLLKVAAAGKVDIAQSTIDILANPEIVAGPEGKKGANDLAGLTVPIRIEGPLDSPKIKPELKGMFASPEQANKTVKQIGEVIKKKFKGKPVGEAIGRFLGNVQIGPHGGGGGDADTGEAEPPGRKAVRQAAHSRPSLRLMPTPADRATTTTTRPTSPRTPTSSASSADEFRPQLPRSSPDVSAKVISVRISGWRGRRTSALSVIYFGAPSFMASPFRWQRSSGASFEVKRGFHAA